MKKKIKLTWTLFGILVLIANLFFQTSCSPKVYTQKNIYGVWETNVDEPVDGKCTIRVVWKSDNTADATFNYENGNVYKTTVKWNYKDGIYDEVYEDGSTGKAKIVWVNKNEFKLYIVENQDTENYEGRFRVYKRIK